jgi:hypothetical protein
MGAFLMSTEADSFITALQSSLTGHKEKLRVFRSTVTGITSGLISFQRGDDTVANDAGRPGCSFALRWLATISRRSIWAGHR